MALRWPPRTTLLNLSAILSIPAILISATTSAAPPTFSKQVAPILFAHCARCHQSGEIASSVSILTYEKARSWAKDIREKVLLKEMPPWPADPHRSLPFRNDARLDTADIQTLVAWVDAGSPPGEPSDMPAIPRAAQGWLHPGGVPPDAVIRLPESEVPAAGEVPYVTHLVKIPFAEDKWIRAIQVWPGNGAVVHHMAITEVRAEPRFGSDSSPLALFARNAGFRNNLVLREPVVAVPGEGGVYDLLGVYTPGQPFEMYGEGAAKLLKGGKDYYLDFNIHYQTTGKPEKDQSAMALWFQPQPPKRQIFRLNGAAESLVVNGRESLADDPGEKAEGTAAVIPPIPPHAANYEVVGMTAYTEPITIYQLHPHAHLRAKDFTYTAVYRDGREQTLLSIPKYDFHWQLAYDLEKPLVLPAGSKLVVTAHYDNSVNNPANPAPEKEVHFLASGNQSWDEMFTPFIQFAVDTENQAEHAEIVETAGCLSQTAAGNWQLDKAAEPVRSTSQATSAAALKADAAGRLGAREYQLIGAEFFHPAADKGSRIAVKGALIPGDSRINVTSLQRLAAGCAE